MKGFLPAEERYQRDPVFRQLVDVMVLHIRDLQLTPTELREAAMLACVKFEMMSPRPLMFEYDSIRRRAEELQIADLPEHLKRKLE